MEYKYLTATLSLIRQGKIGKENEIKLVMKAIRLDKSKQLPTSKEALRKEIADEFNKKIKIIK